VNDEKYAITLHDDDEINPMVQKLFRNLINARVERKE